MLQNLPIETMKLVVLRVDSAGDIAEVVCSEEGVQVLVLDERLRGRAALQVAGSEVSPYVLLENLGRNDPARAVSLAKDVAHELDTKVNHLGLSHRGRVQARLTADSLLKEGVVQTAG